jgi:hypothetical protein
MKTHLESNFLLKQSHLPLQNDLVSLLELRLGGNPL